MSENDIDMFGVPKAEKARKIEKTAEPAIVSTIDCVKAEQHL